MHNDNVYLHRGGNTMANSSEVESKKIVKRKRKIRFGRVIIVLSLLFYLSMFTYAFFGQMMKTYIVNYGEIEDSNNAVGYVIRNEQVITNNFAANLKPIKNEGERVAKGSIIATAFRESTDEIEGKISETEEKMQSAIKEQENNKLASAIFSEDIRKIDHDTEQKVSELCHMIDGNDFDQIVQIKLEIDDNLKKRAEISGEIGPASQYIKSLLNEKKVYENKLAMLKENIRADFAGVISYNTDGLEGVLTPSSIPMLNIEQLVALENNVQNGNTAGGIKVVDNFECFITVVLDNKFKKDRINDTKKNVWLRFLGSENELVPAIIYNVSEEDKGKVLITFIIDEKVENLINLRKINLDIIWATSKGLKIPASSLVKKDNKDGVMVVKANYTKFQEVSIVDQNNEYAIIEEANSWSDKGISLYDEIILNGSNAEEGRQVRKWNF